MPRINLDVTVVPREEWGRFGIDSSRMLEIKTIWDMFCVDCGAILKPVRNVRRFREKGQQWEVVYLIARCCGCGIEYGIDHWIETLWMRRTTIELTTIIEGKRDWVTLPTVKRDCKKCGSTTHTYYSTQTRSSDEPETTFYRCTKCGKVQRENV